jgi:hypothetical protein
MAAGKRGRKNRQPTPDDVTAFTGLTREELRALEEELEKELINQDKQLESLEFPDKAIETPEGMKEYLKEIDYRYRLPPDLVAKLAALVENLLRARTPDEIKYDRWRAVREALWIDAASNRIVHSFRQKFGDTHWDGTQRETQREPPKKSPYALASFLLRDTAASASAQMVELDYWTFEQSLPAAERYPIRRKSGRRRSIRRCQGASSN